MNNSCKNFIAIILISATCGCKQKKEPAPPHNASIEIILNFDYHATASDFEDLLQVLAKQGHCNILINDTHVYLPPVNEWPKKYRVVSNRTVEVNLPKSDYKHPYQGCPRELQVIEQWIKQYSIEAISIAFGTNVDIDAALAVLDLLNAKHVYFSLSLCSDNNVTTLRELTDVSTQNKKSNQNIDPTRKTPVELGND